MCVAPASSRIPPSKVYPIFMAFWVQPGCGHAAVSGGMRERLTRTGSVRGREDPILRRSGAIEPCSGRLYSNFKDPGRQSLSRGWPFGSLFCRPGTRRAASDASGFLLYLGEGWARGVDGGQFLVLRGESAVAYRIFYFAVTAVAADRKRLVRAPTKTGVRCRTGWKESILCQRRRLFGLRSLDRNRTPSTPSLGLMRFHQSHRPTVCLSGP